MEYTLKINEEERNLILIDLQEMISQEDFYDKDLAKRIFYKIIYARRSNGDEGNHYSEV